ncbi:MULTISPECIES: MFS transporter [unclassified Streptomyces]|uniref:MFS transporter n=1 Tax=unclassified Streptomyces TaxID=2593676 RepID=UPI001BE7D8A4|nr:MULTISPECIES: MFS transporter [unclassified Streptomyces]MBT2402873.1 MFS transporter [Streptomyces sp. ISL-21]MBT2612021.1 MFS transporter [Streptomyces sp. ISL-87]
MSTDTRPAAAETEADNAATADNATAATDAAPRERAAVWATFKEAPLAVKTVLAGVLVNRLSGFLHVFLVLFLTDAGHSKGHTVIALGVYGAGAVAGSLVGGTLADRLGIRHATVLSMSSTAVLTAALLYLPDFTLLLGAIALVSLGAQLFRPASATLLADQTDGDRQIMIFAMYRFGLNVGATAAPLLGYALYNAGGHEYTLLFWGEAAIALLYALVARATLPAKARRQPAAAVAAAVADATAPATPGGYGAVLRDRRYLLYLAAAFFHSAVYMQYLSTLPLYMKDAQMALFWYTFAVALNGFIVIAFELLVTKLSQQWPLKITVGLGFALVGAGVACYGLPIGPAAVVIGTLVWSLGEILGGPAVFAYPASAGPEHLRSRYIGSFQFMFGLGSALGPMAGTWLFLQFGSLVWPLVGACSLLATLFGLIAVRPRPAAPEPVTAA